VRLNSVELHYLESGKGVSVIFVHGGLDDHRMWEAQLEPFSQKYHVIAYSRRYNFPNNNPHLRPDHSAIIEADDLAALIKKLKLGPVHVVGHSYGALTALFLAVKHPELAHVSPGGTAGAALGAGQIGR
jgi:pimeloyl-ACP methyl ester carboxylesterase